MDKQYNNDKFGKKLKHLYKEQVIFSAHLQPQHVLNNRSVSKILDSYKGINLIDTGNWCNPDFH